MRSSERRGRLVHLISDSHAKRLPQSRSTRGYILHYQIHNKCTRKTKTQKHRTHNPSSSSLIPSSVCAGSDVLKYDDDSPPIRTRFDFFRAGVSIPSSSVSMLTLRDRSPSPAPQVSARLSERFERTFSCCCCGGGRGRCAALLCEQGSCFLGALFLEVHLFWQRGLQEAGWFLLLWWWW